MTSDKTVILMPFAGQPDSQCQQMQQMMMLVPGLDTITADALQTALQTPNLGCGEMTLEGKLEALGKLVQLLIANCPAQVKCLQMCCILALFFER